MSWITPKISMESDSRLTTLEVSFKVSQKTIEDHIERQEKAFTLLGDSLANLVTHNEDKIEKLVTGFEQQVKDMGKHNDVQLQQLKIDICEKIGGQYATTKEVAKDIRDSEKLMFTKLTAIGTGVMAVMSFLGWLYVESHKVGFKP